MTKEEDRIAAEQKQREELEGIRKALDANLPGKLQPQASTDQEPVEPDATQLADRLHLENVDKATRVFAAVTKLQEAGNENKR
jgi:hypothetical protein